MDREHIEGSAEKAKGTFEDTAGKVTDDRKLLDEVGSKNDLTTARFLELRPGVLFYCRNNGASSPRVRRPCQGKEWVKGGTFRQKL